MHIGTILENRLMKNILLTLTLLAISATPAMAAMAIGATFDDLYLPPDSYWNGSDGSGYFESGGMTFYNDYNAAWYSWSGFAYSNMTDTTTPGWMNQYSAYAGSGVHGSSNYAVNYQNNMNYATTSTLGEVVQGTYITNTTYAALSMLNGDAYSKKFGGVTGNDEDWFLLTITGYDVNVEVTGTVEFYLADYRFANNNMDYIIDQWAWVDLSGLGEITMLEFGLSSSDVGQYGMNTPAYFAMDNLGAIPEPTTIAIFAIGSLAFYRRRRDSK